MRFLLRIGWIVAIVVGGIVFAIDVFNPWLVSAITAGISLPLLLFASSLERRWSSRSRRETADLH